MRYNINETLERMLRILGEERMVEYQNVSASYDFYGRDPSRKIFVDNPLKNEYTTICFSSK